MNSDKFRINVKVIKLKIKCFNAYILAKIYLAVNENSSVRPILDENL